MNKEPSQNGGSFSFGNVWWNEKEIVLLPIIYRNYDTICIVKRRYKNKR